jgi:hypothetical protein
MTDISELSKYLSECTEKIKLITQQIKDNPTPKLYKDLDLELEKIIHAVSEADFPRNDKISEIFTKSMIAKTLTRHTFHAIKDEHQRI